MPHRGGREDRPIGRATDASQAPDAGDGPPAGSLSHGLAILEAFSAEAPVLSVADLTARLGLHKSSVSRLAATLERAGYLEGVGERGKYRLGSKLTRLGGLAGADLDLRRVARPLLAELVQVCGETAHLGLLEGREAVTIDFIDGWHTVRMHTFVGKRSPAHCSSIGKALLAGLPGPDLDVLLAATPLESRTPQTITGAPALKEHLRQLRVRGWSFDDEELEPGLCCVGAPIFVGDGRVTAAISVSGPPDRINRDTVDLLGGRVRAVAAEISARLGAPARRRSWGPEATPVVAPTGRGHFATAEEGGR